MTTETAAQRFARITIDPVQMDGVPCVRGLRIPVSTVVGMVADGMREREILDAYPDLEPEDIRAAAEASGEAAHGEPAQPGGRARVR